MEDRPLTSPEIEWELDDIGIPDDIVCTCQTIEDALDDLLFQLEYDSVLREALRLQGLDPFAWDDLGISRVVQSVYLLVDVDADEEDYFL